MLSIRVYDLPLAPSFHLVIIIGFLLDIFASLLNLFCKFNSTIPFLTVSEQAFPLDWTGPAHRKVEDEEPLRSLGCES